MTLTIRRADVGRDLPVCHSIRHDVFVVGQNVPAALEQDGLDNECIHYLATLHNEPVGTARVRVLDDRFKIQRVAVLDDKQGNGIGAALMRFMLDDLRAMPDRGGRFAFLGSQVHAIAFYERLGFEVCSDAFLDAGIPHKHMRLDFQA